MRKVSSFFQVQSLSYRNTKRRDRQIMSDFEMGRSGSARWRYTRVHAIVMNPFLAGAYVYGNSESRMGKRRPVAQKTRYVSADGLDDGARRRSPFPRRSKWARMIG